MIITKFVLLPLPIGGGGLETLAFYHPGFCYMRYMIAQIVFLFFISFFFPCDFLRRE